MATKKELNARLNQAVTEFISTYPEHSPIKYIECFPQSRDAETGKVIYSADLPEMVDRTMNRWISGDNQPDARTTFYLYCTFRFLFCSYLSENKNSSDSHIKLRTALKELEIPFDLQKHTVDIVNKILADFAGAEAVPITSSEIGKNITVIIPDKLSPVNSIIDIMRGIKDGALFSTLDIEEAVNKGILPKRASHEHERFFNYYSQISAETNTAIPVSYLEIFGLLQGQTYVENQNLFFTYEDIEADIKGYLNQFDNFNGTDFMEKTYREEEEIEALRGNTYHPKKLWIKKFLRSQTGINSFKLDFTFGQGGYLEHKVYQKALSISDKVMEDFENTITNNPGNSMFENEVWCNCGGGIFILTKDDYLVMSHRSSKNVSEFQGMISYSSSGFFNRYCTDSDNVLIDNTPSVAMANEIKEELGILNVSPDDLTLISFGIYPDRQMIQFSYFWKCPLTSSEIVNLRTRAIDAGEQKMFFIPFKRANINRWLEYCEFEPGAAFALYEILQNGESLLDIQLI